MVGSPNAGEHDGDAGGAEDWALRGGEQRAEPDQQQHRCRARADHRQRALEAPQPQSAVVIVFVVNEFVHAFLLSFFVNCALIWALILGLTVMTWQPAAMHAYTICSSGNFISSE